MLLLCTGPLPTTIGDFWRMIWEYKAVNIVMLTGVVEAGKVRPQPLCYLINPIFTISCLNTFVSTHIFILARCTEKM